MMPLLLEAEPVPLAPDSDGTLRVGATRVTLDSIVAAYHSGATAEAIADRFPSVGLSEVYGVLGWYLRHRDEADDYLQQRRNEAEQLQQEVERLNPANGLRARLLGRELQQG